MRRPAASELVQRLIGDYNYSADGAEMVSGDLIACSDVIWGAFWQWWQGGTLPGLSVEGYTVATLMREHSLNPFAAFLTLDWLLSEPEKALAALDKGHDELS